MIRKFHPRKDFLKAGIFDACFFNCLLIIYIFYLVMIFEKSVN